MKLGAYLSKHDISQSEFAARIGLSGASLSRLVKGIQRPNLDTLLAIERETKGAVMTADFADVAHSAGTEAAE